jgi:predicted secreted protein
MKHPTAIFVLLSALAVTGVASAQTLPAPQGVLTLMASASVEVPRDVLAITFSTTRDASDAGAVQTALKQALDAALAEARKSAKPGQVDVQAGNFSIHPRYSNKGVITGWMGTAEMTVEGRDIGTIAQLAGRISTMTIARVGYALSRQAREKVEAEVVAEAIARYRAKAESTSKEFGFSGYAIREVNVTTDEPQPMHMAMMRRAATSDAAAQEALPVEPGRGTVTATVHGSVQMR